MPPPAEKKKQQVSRAEGSQSLPDDLVWGLNTVREAVRHTPKSISEILVQRGKAGPKYQEIIDQARSNRIKLRFVDVGRLGIPGRASHQGVVARLAAVELISFEELLAEIKPAGSGEMPRILVLDSIQDPRNLGAVLRSALAAGFTSVVLTRERSAPLTGTVAKTSAGAVSQLKIAQVVNLADALKKMQQSGFWVFGAVPDSAALSVYAADFRVPLCLVIGGEDKGIRPLVQKGCDQLVTIPMQGDFDSLNVSVAAAVVMFEVGRQQMQQSN